MKIDIIIVYIPRYERGHGLDFVPPITGLQLAAITPAEHDVRVFHQQVDAIDYDTDADLIALSFFSGFANEAYRLADRFKERGKTVVAGGPHVTYLPEEALQHVDTVIAGEAERSWPEYLGDLGQGTAKRLYRDSAPSLDGLPTPRYDLLSDRYVVRRVVQATRGCPFSCSFCTVPSLNPGFRTRPIDDVIRDLEYDDFPHWWQRKVVWFWDDNLTVKRKYIKPLLREMIPLNKWWLTQASLDIVKDDELLDLMERSGCIGVFFGIESFGLGSLEDANKRQNKVARYKAAVDKMHARGIAVMAGFIAGFDHDTPASIVAMADQLYEIGVDVPFLSILTPFAGTPLYDQLQAEGRMLEPRNWDMYNGYNVSFWPQEMSPARLLESHRALWNRAFSPAHAAGRLARATQYLRPGALMLTAAMNGFYGTKQLLGNEPKDHAAANGIELPPSIWTPDVPTKDEVSALP